jgi:hypothetical protein
MPRLYVRVHCHSAMRFIAIAMLLLREERVFGETRHAASLRQGSLP